MTDVASKAARFMLPLILVIGLFASPARADYRSSALWFSAKTETERVVLQATLILLGHYRGLIDAVFGKHTYEAVLSYEVSQRLEGDGVLTPVEEQKMLLEAGIAYETLGFHEETDDRAGIKIPIPTNLFSSHSPSKWGTRWESADNSIELETLAVPQSDVPFEVLFRRLSRGSGRVIEYKLFADTFFVLSGLIDERKFYAAVRSGSISRGFSISWDKSKENVGAVVSTYLASMIEYPEAAAFGALEGGQQPEPTPSSQPFGGSGFAISVAGTIVTNAHLVTNCREIEVPNFGPARLITTDPDRDLAVIQVARNKLTTVAQIRTGKLELGQAVVALGYPLSDVMGNALTVSPGVVASLSGLGGDQDSFTVSANIQPGNSGGPVLDTNGDVVGVTVAKLNEVQMLKDAGTTGASLGFAIDAHTLADFLAPFKSSTTVGAALRNLSVQAIVARAKEFTVQVICRN